MPKILGLTNSVRSPYLRRQISGGVNKRGGYALGEDRPAFDHPQVPTDEPDLFCLRRRRRRRRRRRESRREQRRREVAIPGLPHEMREAEISSGRRLTAHKARRGSGGFSEDVCERVPPEKTGDRTGAAPQESAVHGRLSGKKRGFGAKKSRGFRWKSWV